MAKTAKSVRCFCGVTHIFKMDPFTVTSHSEEETWALAKHLAGHLKAGDIVCLYGDLGSGKTTFTKGLAQGLKIKMNKVHSPTFTLMNIYEGKRPLYHFDLYRMDDIKEILNIGYEEFLFGDGIAVVEWADKLKSLLPEEFMEVRFSHAGENERTITLCPHGEQYSVLLGKLRS